MPLVSLQNALLGLGQGDPNEAIHGSELSGPRGIEAIIEYNGLYLNVREWIDTFLVTNILGLDDADVRDTRENNPGQHGETPGSSNYGGRTLVLQGKIQTKTLWKLRDMQFALRQTFADISVERPLVFHGTQIQHDYLCYCKKNQKMDMPEEQTTPNHFERTFNITLRASNPRFVSIATEYYIWSYEGLTSVDEIVFTAVNTGNFPSQPLIDIAGPMTNPRLINEHNGNILEFIGSIPSGESWRIDFQSSSPRMFNVDTGVSVFNMLQDNSTDFLYDPGVQNSIRLTATGLTSASKIESRSQHTLM
jgi:hypothetical protein